MTSIFFSTDRARGLANGASRWFEPARHGTSALVGFARWTRNGQIGGLADPSSC
jgi:hypothetical protein